MKYIENIFYALNLPWRYMPNDDDLSISIKLFFKYYDKKLINMLKMIIGHNKSEFLKRKKYKKYKKYPKWFIMFLCWFVTKKKNRDNLRKKYI
jgi:ribosome-associated toxin RatA of RatAB toxin-antitoxin module